MDPIIGGSLIAGGASLLGNLFGQSSQQQANQTNIELQREAWLRDDSALQRKVADAIKAGIHPSLVTNGGMSSSSATVQPLIKENPVDQMYQAVQRHRDLVMSKTQQELTEAQVQTALATSRIEKKKAEIFESTGVLPGQEPNFMGLRMPAGWIKGYRDITKSAKPEDWKTMGGMPFRKR